MTTKSLIEKIGAFRASQPWSPSFLQGIDDCLAMIRAHEAEQPQDMVERVAKAIQATTEDATLGETADCAFYQVMAKAAIAAMQEGK